MIEATEHGPTRQRPNYADSLGIGFVVGQLILIALLLYQLDMLPVNFRRVFCLAVPGFLVHHLLPARLRLTFFAFFSVCSLYVALIGPTASNGFWDPVAFTRASAVLVVGTVLAAICRLPIGFWKRALLLTLAGAVLAAFRTGKIPSTGLELIWIIIPMLFMFRLVSYFYDLSTSASRPTLVQSLAYFFMFPVACFSILIPIIDFKTFCRSHYSDQPLATYQRGIRRIARGLVQMLIYRYVSEIFSIEFDRIRNGIDLIRYLATAPLFYLSVSGHFHFITGSLLLFGFNLPETNNNYFLASSFTDQWRRINIYWKDFTLKVFYYPAYFRLKKFGSTPALVVATFWAFILSWAFHVYLVFWSSGVVSTSWKHLFYWLIWGSLVLVNSLQEMKPGQKRSTTNPTVVESLWLAVKTAATFTVIWVVLDTFGNSPSFSGWISVWKLADWHTWSGLALILFAIMTAKIVLEIMPTARRKPGNPRVPESVAPIRLRRDVLQCATPLLGLYLMAALAISSHPTNWGLQKLSPKLNIQRFLNMLESGDSFITESSAEELNFYKSSTYFHEGSRQLEEIFIGRRIPRMPLNDRVPTVPTQDYRSAIMEASAHAATNYPEDFKTNQWGMRDLEYELNKPANTRRIALLGSTHVVGYGVNQKDLFESLVEERLNHSPATHEPALHWEILNFAQSGFDPLAQLDVLRLQAGRFQPDIVLLVGHLADFPSVNHRLRMLQRRGEAIPDEFLTKTLADARVIRYINLSLAEQRLHPYETNVIAWTLERIAEECKRINATPLFVFLPDAGFEIPMTPVQLEKTTTYIEMARKAGFATIDLAHVFVQEKRSSLVTTGLDQGNAKAHALIAEALYQQLNKLAGISLAKPMHAASDQTEN